MNPAPPVTSTFVMSAASLSVGRAAEGTEDVRHVPDASKSNRKMETRVFRYRCVRPQALQVDELVLGRKAAALGVVVPGNALLQNRLALNVPTEAVDGPVTVLLQSYGRVGVEEVRMVRDVLASGVRPVSLLAPSGHQRDKWFFPCAVGAEELEFAVPPVELGSEVTR